MNGGNERGKPTSQKPLTAVLRAKQSIKRQLHTAHVAAGGSWFWCMCPLNFNLSFENSDLNCSLHKEFEISTLHSKFFEILKFVFLSEVAHKSFWVKFSGLISKLKILEKSY